MSKFAYALRRLRKERGLTQHELAKAVKVSQGFISQLERGTRRPGFALTKLLATTLGVAVTDLLAIHDDDASAK